MDGEFSTLPSIFCSDSSTSLCIILFKTDTGHEPFLISKPSIAI